MSDLTQRVAMAKRDIDYALRFVDVDSPKFHTFASWIDLLSDLEAEIARLRAQREDFGSFRPDLVKVTSYMNAGVLEVRCVELGWPRWRGTE